MAVLPTERVIQRTRYYGVSVVKSKDYDITDGEVLWNGNTLGNNITTDKTVAGNQAVHDDTVARVDATT